MTKLFHPPQRSAAATLFLPGESAQANASADREVFSDRPRPVHLQETTTSKSWASLRKFMLQNSPEKASSSPQARLILLALTVTPVTAHRFLPRLGDVGRGTKHYFRCYFYSNIIHSTWCHCNLKETYLTLKETLLFLPNISALSQIFRKENTCAYTPLPAKYILLLLKIICGVCSKFPFKHPSQMFKCLPLTNNASEIKGSSSQRRPLWFPCQWYGKQREGFEQC